jgi:primosomal protein N'
MRAEYDFSKGVRGKYARRFAEGTNVVVLDPDVALVFPDSKSVNDALRALARVADRHTRRRPKTRAANKSPRKNKK